MTLLMVCAVSAQAEVQFKPQLSSEQSGVVSPLANNGASSTEGDMSSARSNEKLDELFEKLRKQIKKPQAQATANKIWREWFQSGSASINMLMRFANRATDEKNYPAAIDLLDQITTLAPEYAEGWNRRATVHFHMGDFSRSLADIETTLRLEPRHFGSLSGLAAILQRLNREEDALDTWYKVLEIYPANDLAQKAVIKLEEELAGSRT